jgi:hypothetical protein
LSSRPGRLSEFGDAMLWTCDKSRVSFVAKARY